MGAGASLAEAQARRGPKRAKEWPPLDTNFFQRVAKHRRHRSLYARVQAQARRLGEPDLARTNPPVGLEDYLGRLYFNLQHDPIKAGAGAYFDMLDLYAEEVIETTQWMMGKPGLMKEVLQNEIRAGRRVSVITFNIDLLIENALERLAHGRPPNAAWALKDAYGFETPLRQARGDEEPFDYAGTADIKLFKMHGSLNWVFPTRDYHPPADLVGKPRELRQVLDRRLPTGRIRIRMGPPGGKGRRVWYAYPLIVPPVYEKHAFIRMHLQEVWDHAEDALADAQKVVFWGYSFPATDIHARHFFQGMADRNPVLGAPVIVNPDPAVGAALWSLLRARRVTQYGDISEYLAA